MYISIILYMNKKIKHFLRILNHFNAFFWFLRVLLVFLREIGFMGRSPASFFMHRRCASLKKSIRGYKGVDRLIPWR